MGVHADREEHRNLPRVGAAPAARAHREDTEDARLDEHLGDEPEAHEDDQYVPGHVGEDLRGMTEAEHRGRQARRGGAPHHDHQAVPRPHGLEHQRDDEDRGEERLGELHHGTKCVKVSVSTSTSQRG